MYNYLKILTMYHKPTQSPNWLLETLKINIAHGKKWIVLLIGTNLWFAHLKMEPTSAARHSDSKYYSPPSHSPKNTPSIIVITLSMPLSICSCR